MKLNEGATVIGREIQFRGDNRDSAGILIDGEVDGGIRLPFERLTVRADVRFCVSIMARVVVGFELVGVKLGLPDVSNLAAVWWSHAMFSQVAYPLKTGPSCG